MQPKWSKLQRFIWESRETRGLKASGQSIYCPNGNTDIFLLVKAGNIDRTIRVGSNKNTIIKGTSVRFITQFLTAMITSWNVMLLKCGPPFLRIGRYRLDNPCIHIVAWWTCDHFRFMGPHGPLGPLCLHFSDSFWAGKLSQVGEWV